ncbi:MAG: hypothetical protein KGH86_07930 [Thaumarchaeota archaeon]|nr:hypothetical protein [Nitrososphaerota archaeon]
MNHKGSCRKARLLLYITQHPFCSKTDICESGNVSSNGPDVGEDLKELIQTRRIKKANWWNNEVYYIQNLLEPSDRITANLLENKDEIFSKIESNKHIMSSKLGNEFIEHYNMQDNFAKITKSRISLKLMKYENNLDPEKSLFEQIVRKYLVIYFLKTQNLLLEYKKNCNSSKANAIVRREVRLVEFLLEFRGFITKNNNEIFLSQSFSDHTKISEHLDRIYNVERYHQHSLWSGRKSMRDSIKTYFISRLKTKKDASEIFDLSMKQTGNTISSLQNSDKTPNFEKMYQIEQVESGNSMLCVSDDISFFMLVESVRQTLNDTPRGPKYDYLVKQYKMLFPEISLDD